MPFGFYNAALNFGISAGIVFPWGSGFLNKPSSLPERFFLGGDFSPVCTLGGPTTVWGFKTRGIGPTEPRRQNSDKPDGGNSDSSGRDVIGGDLAVTAFADLSFDLPIHWLREHGVHGHIFAGSGNLAKLTENEYRNFSIRKFYESFRSSVGAGIVVPTKFFRLEVSFHILSTIKNAKLEPWLISWLRNIQCTYARCYKELVADILLCIYVLSGCTIDAGLTDFQKVPHPIKHAKESVKMN